MTDRKMVLSYIWRCFTGPSLYKRYKSPAEPGRVYYPNQLESKADTVLWCASMLKSVLIFVSPLLVPTLYRRGYFTQEYAFRLGIFLLIIYGGSYLCRGFGRMANADYLTFLTVLDECQNTPLHAANRRFLREFDFEFWAWPQDYVWKDTIHGEAVRTRKFLANDYDYQPYSNQIMASLSTSVGSAISNVFGRRLLYPGSVGLMNLLLQNVLLDGRSKLVEEKGGKRFKLITKRGKTVDSMFVDKRNTSETGSILVISCEGNAGFYEIGATGPPLDAGFSVLGWNHPGFGGSSGEAMPIQDAESIDVVIQFATSELGFNTEDIVLFAWSIGGFSATWAAMNYPNIRGIVLDATFDDVIPLAKNAMPLKISSFIHQIMREHLNMPINKQAIQYQGPICLIRRAKDEIIATDQTNAIKILESNRGTHLARDILKFRFPNLFSEISEQKWDDFVVAQSNVSRELIMEELGIKEEYCSQMLAQAANTQLSANSTLFPMEIGSELSELDRAKLLIFITSKFLKDFDTTHCTPLPAEMFEVPKHPWNKLID